MKAGKDPRPIVVSTIESRVVQRAILDSLQPKQDTFLHSKLGRIRQINESEFSIGGTSSGGVRVGIEKVLRAIGDGYTIFFKSDIRGFFTRIPHTPVLDFILKETQDVGLCKLFEMALGAELENQDALGRYLYLFPSDDIGVPQGSSLSAFAGNVALSEFDSILNTPETHAFRYIDDFIILGKTNEAVQKAKAAAIKELRKFGMSLYEPGSDSDKADQGHTRNGFAFLGCVVHNTRVSPSKKGIETQIDRVRNEIEAAKKTILSLECGLSRNSEVAFAQSLRRIDDSLRSWAKSYAFITDRLPFTQADERVDKLLIDYLDWFRDRVSKATAQQRRRMYGIYLLRDTNLSPVNAELSDLPIGQTSKTK